MNIALEARLYNLDQWLHAVDSAISAGPTEVRVSCQNISGGIREDGSDIREVWNKNDQVATMLDKLCACNTRILVGVFPAKDCGHGGAPCVGCATERLRVLSRLAGHMRAWPGIGWRVTSEVPHKTMLFSYADGSFRAIVGDRNITAFTEGQAVVLSGPDLDWDAQDFDWRWGTALEDCQGTWEYLSRVPENRKPPLDFDPLNMLGIPLPVDTRSGIPVFAQDDDIPF